MLLNHIKKKLLKSKSKNFNFLKKLKIKKFDEKAIH